MHKEEEYIARDAQIHFCLQSIHMGYGSLEENLANILGMFSDHFQNIFVAYPMTYSILDSSNARYKVVPHKVPIYY